MQITAKDVQEIVRIISFKYMFHIPPSLLKYPRGKSREPCRGDCT